MAIDQNAILQLLTQLQGGGSPPISPSSGLQDPSLSGLALGEQGMGFGGGGSILGGGRGGIGGTEGPGLDLLSLLNQPQPESGGPGTQRTLGQFPTQFPSFGAGGQLQESPVRAGTRPDTLGQAARAGVGGGGTAASILALLKTLASAGTKLPGFFGTGSISPDVALAGIGGIGAQALPDVLLEAGGATGGALGTGLLGTGGQAALASNLGADVLTEAGAGGGLGAAPAVGGGIGASLPTLGADATQTAAGFGSALSPIGGVLSLLSLADLFGAPNIGIGNIFRSQRINDFNAAQTEAAIRNAVAGAQAGGPIETNFAQRGLDAQLIASVFPNLTPVGELPQTATPLERQLQGILAGVAKTGPFVPGATLDPSLLTALQAVNPSAFNPQAEAQRRYRTLAGFPFLPPPPAIESAVDPRAQRFFRQEDPLAGVSA